MKILKEKYGLDVEVRPEKVREVIRTSEKCRKIICTDTMEIFDSYLHAGKAMELSPIGILSVCCGTENNLYGYHFQYYDKNKTYTQTEKGYEFHYRRVKCIETGEVFLSINAAIKILSSIQDVLYENQKTAGGLHWEYTDDQPTDTTKTETLINEYLKTFTRKKAVVCLDDGKTFDSCTDASKYYGIYEAGITRCCVGWLSQTHNLHFQYIDEPHPFIQKEIEYKKVVCDDLGIVFNSVKEAKEYFNAPNENTISVKTLLNACPIIPLINTVRQSSNPTPYNRIILPFLRDLQEACYRIGIQSCDYRLVYRGKELSENEIKELSYEDFYSDINLHFLGTWIDYPSRKKTHYKKLQKGSVIS